MILFGSEQRFVLNILLKLTSSTSGLVRAVVLEEHRVRRLPPAPGRRLQRLCWRHWNCGGEWWRCGGREQRGEAHSQGRRGGGAGVRGGSLVAVAPLEGPGAALHLTQAADGVEDDGGPVDGELGQVQVGGLLAVRIGADPVLQVRGEGARLGDKTQV